jgi:hypothetical protein
VTCIQGLLEKLAPDVEASLKPRLTGFIGAMVRAYLPQHWAFVTEEGTTTVRIDPTGSVTVLPGAVASPDVTVRGDHDGLRTILERRERPAGPTPGLSVVAHTAKGRAAVDQVRSRFGF